MAHPVEVFKFCPRCGSADFAASGPRSLKCTRCGFQLYINSATAVACLIFNSKGQLLVTRRAIDPDAGKLDLPGGFVDPLETAEAAVHRELMEELGMKVSRLRYITSAFNQYHYSGITVFTTDLAFRVEAENTEHLTANDDISSFAWMDPCEIDENEIAAPSIRFFIKEIAPNEQKNH